MTNVIDKYLDLLDEQRKDNFTRLAGEPDAVLWYRPGPKVWSIGEHLDHTRAIHCFTRRPMNGYYPLAWPFARLFRGRPYKVEIDDVYKRPGFPMNVGWIWPPKYRPSRPVRLGLPHDALQGEHAACRRSYATHDEQILGHIVLAAPVIGVLHLVQWLRVQAYHDAHHSQRVSVRLSNPEYASEAMNAQAARAAAPTSGHQTCSEDGQ